MISAYISEILPLMPGGISEIPLLILQSLVFLTCFLCNLNVKKLFNI